MSAPLVELDAVSKTFAGRTVVDRLSFRLAAGEVLALIGPNGAGKTTSVRMLVGILRPDSGHIVACFDGERGERPPPHRTGYLPEERGLYRELPVLRTLVYFGMLRGLERRAARAAAESWLERLGLADRAEERIDALSKGNQQRVQVAAALLHRPALAILDEPFSGLDPLSQELLLDLVAELRGAGTAVLLSAHQMDLVERAADRVLLMNRGRQILAGSLHELRALVDPRPRLRLELADGGDPAPLLADPAVAEHDRAGTTLHLTLRGADAVPQFLARSAARVPLRSITSEQARLHDVFVRAVREDGVTVGAVPS